MAAWERTVVEGLVDRLEPRRHVGTRSEQRAANDSALITIAAVLRWR